MSLLVILAGLSYCKTPNPELSRGKNTDSFKRLVKKSPEINQMVSLDKCVSLALRNNLEVAAAARKSELAAIQANGSFLTVFSMFPDIRGEWGASDRSREAAWWAEAVEGPNTGQVTVPPSISREKFLRSWNISVTWSLVDFGISYYNWLLEYEQGISDKIILIRTASELVRRVENTYFELAAAQKKLRLAREIAANQEFARKQISVLAGEGIIEPPMPDAHCDIFLSDDYLCEQSAEVEKLRLMLSRLIGISPSSKVKANPAALEIIPENLSCRQLESAALARRPELYLADSSIRVAETEVRKALIECFPTFEVFHDWNYVSDKHALNKHYRRYGYKFAYNLVKSAENVINYKSAKVKVSREKLKMLNLSWTILVQSRLAYLDFLSAKRTLAEYFRRFQAEKQRLEKKHAAYTAGGTSTLDFLKARNRCLKAEMQHEQAKAWVQQAYSNLKSVTMTGRQGKIAGLIAPGKVAETFIAAEAVYE